MRIVYAVVYVFLLRNILYLQLQLSYSLNYFSSPALIIKISNLYSPFSLSDSIFFLSFLIWLCFKGASVNCESEKTKNTLLIQVEILTI